MGNMYLIVDMKLVIVDAILLLCYMDSMILRVCLIVYVLV